ncbi:nuclease-related domain-containing protein [Candidatus Pyrohabitans sp.]
MARVVNCSNNLKTRARTSRIAPALIILGLVSMPLVPLHAFLLIFAGSMIFLLERRSRAVYISGVKGEREVAKSLSGLDDRFLVVNNYPLGKRGDIDHVVLGPKGLFVIETKNLRGTVSFRNGVFEYIKQGRGGGTYRGTASDPVAQVQRNAARLRRLLEKSAGGEVQIPYVKGVVVFASETRISGELPGNVPVLRPWELRDYIMGHRNVLGKNRQLRIERLLLSAPSSRHGDMCPEALERAWS